MTTRSFTKLFSSITDSSIWDQPDHVRIVWITMLAMADSHGRIHASIPGLASRSRKSIEDVEEALSVFRAPDRYSRTKEFDGRRIEDVEGGWLLLTYEKHRGVRDAEAAKQSRNDWYHRNKGKRGESGDDLQVGESLSKHLQLERIGEPPSASVSVSRSDLDPDRARDCPQVEPVASASNDTGDPREPAQPSGEAPAHPDESPSAPARQTAPTGQADALPGLPRAAVSISERPVEAEGQREVVKSLKGFVPDDDLYAEALALGVTRESFDRRLKDLARGPVGGARGIFRDELRGYVQGQFKTWKVWDETDRYKASQARTGPGLAKTQGDDIERWLPDARHRELARKLKLDAFEELLPEYRRTALPRGQTSAEIDKHFAGWLKERAKAKRAQKGAA